MGHTREPPYIGLYSVASLEVDVMDEPGRALPHEEASEDLTASET